ncbi:oligosaccharide flippase family protein [Shewanella sp. YLB-07]|uniref:oligosaccharide flippase family protein n=1 Tax=Shewanella sp. YLB-07 TaxID=2601268 RepID=UPI00128C676B|nr:oligosaccharide flippase family protein [Shewanella sp. YLB-07]MPY24830.1 oligosaccharide flippase family protein [Shewanella sp. YLB-07]
MPVLDNSQRETRKGLTKGLFSLGSAQVLGRSIRFASSIILARLLTPEVFGEVAIILASFELISAPTRRITSVPLLKMDDKTFHSALPIANKINWFVAIIAFVAMSLLSWPLAFLHQDSTLIPPMILMATSYLLLPLGMLHATSNLKTNEIPVVGQAIMWQTIADGVLTASLALLGLGIWAIIIPKVLVILIWVGIHRNHTSLVYGSDSQCPPAEHFYYQNHAINSRSGIETTSVSHQVASLAKMKDDTSLADLQNLAISIKLIANLRDAEEIKKITHKFTERAPSTNDMLHMGAHIGLYDLSIALRNNIDYLLVGYFLGLEALGVYFFAVTASLGICAAMGQGSSSKVKPDPHTNPPSDKYSSSQSEIRNRYWHSLSQRLKIAVPIIVLQLVFAPLYLPFVYGEHWLDAGAFPVFILFSLCGLIRPYGEAASQLLTNINMQGINLKLNMGFTLLLVLTIGFFSQWGLKEVALGVFLTQLFTTVFVSYYAQSFILKSSVCKENNSSSNNKENKKMAKEFEQELPNDA